MAIFTRAQREVLTDVVLLNRSVAKLVAERLTGTPTAAGCFRDKAQAIEMARTPGAKHRG